MKHPLTGYDWLEGRDPRDVPRDDPLNQVDPNSCDPSGDGGYRLEHSDPQTGRPMTDVDVPDLTTSRVWLYEPNFKGPSHVHVVAIDVDIPCHLIESSPGRHHLIIEKPMEWEEYRRLLVALEAAGIIEPGYLEASLRRGWSGLRTLPTTPTVVDVDHPALKSQAF